MGHESTGKEKLQSVWSFRAFISIWQRSQKDIQHAEKCYLLQVKCYPEEEAPIQNLAHFYHEIGDSTKYKHWSQEQQKIDSIKDMSAKENRR